jgi:hypothetical protein
MSHGKVVSLEGRGEPTRLRVYWLSAAVESARYEGVRGMEDMNLPLLHRRFHEGAERVSRLESLVAGLKQTGADPRGLELAHDLLEGMQRAQGYVEDAIINLAISALDDCGSAKFTAVNGAPSRDPRLTDHARPLSPLHSLAEQT